MSRVNDELVANNYKDKKLYTLKTSGSTGKKLEFLATDDVFKKEADLLGEFYQIPMLGGKL